MNTQSPRWVDPPEHRLGAMHSTRRQIPGSKMFEIKRGLDAFSAANPGIPVFDASQGDGGASLGGIHVQELCDAAMRFTKSTAYGQPDGNPRVRTVLLENYWHLDSLGYTPNHILLCDGGRDALMKWYKAVEAQTCTRGGTLVTSAAPWVSYPQASYLEGLNLLCAPANGRMDFRLTHDGIMACESELNRVPSSTRALMLTTPCNPTGTFYHPDDILRAIITAYSIGFRFILIDLMYQLVLDPDVDLYNWPKILSVLPPEIRACVCLLDGLTKSVGASNVRMAHLVCGDPEMTSVIRNIASHTNMPNVFGEASAFAVYSHADVRNHPWVTRITHATAQSRTILNAELTMRGYEFVSGQGYYAFINVSRWLGNNKFKTAKDLSSFLAKEHGLAVVYGDPFLQPDCIRFSYAQAPETTKAAIERFDAALKSIF